MSLFLTYTPQTIRDFPLVVQSKDGVIHMCSQWMTPSLPDSYTTMTDCEKVLAKQSLDEEKVDLWKQDYYRLQVSTDQDTFIYKGEEYDVLEWKMKDTQGTTPWDQTGIDHEDYELAEYVGLLEPTEAPELQDEIDFQKMIDYEETFWEDMEQDYEEFQLCSSGAVRNCEVIQPKKVYEDVPVRVEYIQKDFAIGSIEGVSCVFVPTKLFQGWEQPELSDELAYLNLDQPITKQEITLVRGKVTVGQMISMNLIYKPRGKNIWKAIYMNPKCEPFVKSKFVCRGYSEMYDIEIPKQMIGKMIGKGGKYIHRIRKDMVYNYPELKRDFQSVDKEHQNDHGWKSDYEPKYIEDTYFPKMDIQQGSETTHVKLFYKIQDYDNSDGSTIRLCPLQDVVKKLYC